MRLHPSGKSLRKMHAKLEFFKSLRKIISLPKFAEGIAWEWVFGNIQNAVRGIHQKGITKLLTDSRTSLQKDRDSNIGYVRCHRLFLRFCRSELADTPTSRDKGGREPPSQVTCKIHWSLLTAYCFDRFLGFFYFWIRKIKNYVSTKDFKYLYFWSF